MSKYHLAPHVRKHPSQEVICEKCGIVFVSKYHLALHVRKHAGQLVICKKCGKVFVSKYHIAPHVRKHKSQEICVLVLHEERLKKSLKSEPIMNQN